MPIPDYQTIMLPLLEFVADKQEHSKSDTTEHLALFFKLSDAERKELLPSGQQEIFDNRVGWARTYLKKAKLIESTRRGFFKITDRGLDILTKKPTEISSKFLEQFPEFVEFKTVKKKDGMPKDGIEISSNQTPEESLEYGYQKIRQDLAQEVLSRIKGCSPSFFERLVVELLVKMGYGGSRKDAGQAIGKTGDEGIDGIIKEDKLGLDVIYIQAKKWDASIGRPEIMKFAGALQGQHAKKGIFITTSYFTDEAEEYARRVDSKIILIDGEELAGLMIDYDIGVSRLAVYEVKKIDSDYYSEE